MIILGFKIVNLEKDGVIIRDWDIIFVLRGKRLILFWNLWRVEL